MVSWLVAVLCCSTLGQSKCTTLAQMNAPTCITFTVSAVSVVGCCCGIPARLPTSQNIWNRTQHSVADCFIPTSECKWWANNSVEMVTFWQQCSAAQAQAHAEILGHLRHACRGFCATMVCISFKVYNTVYREVRPTMYEFAKCCKFCLTLCSRTLETASQTMCWPAHARIGRLSYHLVTGSDIIHNPAFYYTLGYLKKWAWTGLQSLWT